MYTQQAAIAQADSRMEASRRQAALRRMRRRAPVAPVIPTLRLSTRWSDDEAAAARSDADEPVHFGSAAATIDARRLERISA